MKTIYLMCVLLMMSCNDNSFPERSQGRTSGGDVIASDTILKPSSSQTSDTIKRMVLDDYPVSYEMMLNKGDHSFQREKKSGQTYSYDQAWFINDKLKEVLVFGLYTDGFRPVICHFHSNNVPDDLMNQIELHQRDGAFATETQRLKDFNGFLKQAKRIDSSFFVSNKGFKLGDSKQKAIDEYGEAHKQVIVDGFEKLEWKFEGELSNTSRQKLEGKPLAGNSYGYQVLMYFRNDKLMAQIIYNSIP